jgi:ribosomal protein S18 acetylase RimI-like enzyme
MDTYSTGPTQVKVAFGPMDFTITQLTSPAEFFTCAALMVRTNPWSTLNFSAEQCAADLGHSALDVYAAISGDGTLVGFCATLATGIGFEPMLEYLCVDAQFRNNGVGTKLIRYFEEELFPDADNLYLFVADINPDAMRLYVRLGYLQVGALPNFNLPGQTEFLHRKTRRPRQVGAVTDVK